MPSLAHKDSSEARGKRELRAILEISEKIITTLDLKTISDHILKLAIEILEADSGSLMLLDEKTKCLRIKASVGPDKKIVKKTTLKLGERIAGWVAQQSKPTLLLDGLKKYPHFAHLIGDPQIKSSISVPLQIGDKLMGVLNINRLIDSSLPDFTPHHLGLLMILANQAASAINNACLHQEIKTQNTKLARANRIKTNLIATITHELRTPLTAIRGHISNLMEGVLGPVSQTQQEKLQRIETLCYRQSMLINQLLELSRLTTSRLNIKRKPITLEGIVVNVVANLMNLANEKSIKLEAKLPSVLPQVWGVEEQKIGRAHV